MTAVQKAFSAPAVQQAAPLKLHEDIEARTDQFKASLPAHIPVERFKKVLLVAVSSNPALARADKRTFFNSAMKAANDGLLPDGREGALVIYKTKNDNDWIEAVQWMPMIAGIRKKVRNSGEISTWNANVVHKNDEFDFDLSTGHLSHRFKLGEDRGEIIGAYSKAMLKTGESSIEVMDVEEMRAIWRKSSKGKDKEGNPSGPWKDHEGEMFRKTVARRHSKVLPMSTDLDDLIRRDDSLYDFDGKSDAAVKGETAKPQAVLTVVENANEAETFDPETGEVTEGEAEAYGPPDAFAEGEEAALAGKAITDIPERLKGTGPLVDAWQAGFRAAVHP